MFRSLKYIKLNNIRNITGGQVIFNKLKEHNVKDVFIYSGGAIMPLIDTFYKNKNINYYVNTHEQNTGHSATGYAKSTGKTGISIVTSGPGLTNMVTPILDANNDSTPLIVFSGQVPLSAMGTNAFQECPAVDITKSITKWSYCVQNVNELPYIVDLAFKIANDGKKGAVHIDLPKCVLSSEFKELGNNDVAYKKLYYKFNKNKKYKKYIGKGLNFIEDSNNKKIKEIVNLINNSKKPIFYLGQGANSAYKEIREIVKRNNIPVTTTIHGMGIFDETDDLSLEMLGMHGSAYANYSIQNSDCIIAIGCRFDDRTTGNLEKYAPEAMKARKEKRGGIIHCNLNSKDINNIVKCDFTFNCDAQYFSKMLLSLIKRNDRTEYLNEIKKLKITYPFYHNKALNNKIKTQDVLIELNKILLDKNLIQNTIVTTGVGNHQMMSAQFIKWRYPNRFITSGSLGVMGVGLPYSIGCQIGNPNKLVIDIDGDSSFNHTLSDLKTIVEYNLPIKIFIMNDNNQSMVRVWEELFFNERYTATACENNPEYHKLANSYGIKSFYCDNEKDLNKTLIEALNYDGAVLCNFKVETDKCLPLVAPGKGLDEMILDSNINYNDFKNEMAPN